MDVVENGNPLNDVVVERSSSVQADPTPPAAERVALNNDIAKQNRTSSV